MQEYSQKYTLVYLFDELPDGYEYSMENWPPHISIAEIFAINGAPSDLMNSLSIRLGEQIPVETNAIGEDWFGEDKSVHVTLYDKTNQLENLHETIIDVLNDYGVVFNNPQYIHEGFRPHSTIQGEYNKNTAIINSVTLIDMYPDRDYRQRKVLGTVHFTG